MRPRCISARAARCPLHCLPSPTDKFLALCERRRASFAFAAGERAATAAGRILDQAASGKLLLVSRDTRIGGDWNPVSRLKIELLRSLHIFSSCTFDPEQPFDRSAHVLKRHHVFVTESSLARMLRSISAPRVGHAVLSAWVESLTDNLTQAQLIAQSKTAFPGCAPPTEREVKAADAVAREKKVLARRERGAPRRGKLE